jgi:hypothetical protein
MKQREACFPTTAVRLRAAAAAHHRADAVCL